jgi:dihydroorotate dehydrogenase (NAD+) catalytic subunit
MSGNDALEYLICGATAVEVGTSNFIDPESCLTIVKELDRYCQRHGISRIEDIIGTLDVKQ